jgi:phosphoserine phosphatase
VVAAAVGRPEWEERMEILSMRGSDDDQMRERVAPWREHTPAEPSCHLVHARLAPGVDEAFRLLRARGITVAIVSIGWDFMVEWFAHRFGATHWAATRLDPAGRVTPFWPEDKGPWLERLMRSLGTARHEVAAVGDSPRDASLLRAAGHAFYVGADRPPVIEGIRHHPDGDIAQVTRVILGR